MSTNSTRYQAAYDRREAYRRNSAEWLQRNSHARIKYKLRAALEMRSRLPAAGACIKTLHALGYALLRKQKSVRLA